MYMLMEYFVMFWYMCALCNVQTRVNIYIKFLSFLCGENIQKRFF
jgi:hypothetical protein